jgi:hypothetical protein
MHGHVRNGRSQHIHIWDKSTMNQQNGIQNNGYLQQILESGRNDTLDN